MILPKITSLPINEVKISSKPLDWLLVNEKERENYQAKIFRNSQSSEILITNNLINRKIRITPNGATIALDNLMNGEALIRGIKPEALIEIEGKKYPVGGLTGQQEYAYLLPEWLDAMKNDPTSFQLIDIQIISIKERFPWKQKRRVTNTIWPPKGIELQMIYTHPDLPQIDITIHYELYDGLPLLSKWFSIQNKRSKPILLNSFTTEILALVEYESIVENPECWEKPKIHFETDYEFAGFTPKTSNQAIFWVRDPQYSSQVNYLSNGPYMMECRPPIGPEIQINAGENFESFRIYELIFDSNDRERNGLALRKMYRTIAPWVTENPILMHVLSSDPAKIKSAIDQCAEVGFEMIIITFGSMFNIEFEDLDYFEEYQDVFNYAHQKGIELGVYSLFSSRTISLDDDIIDPETNKTSKKAIFGVAPCLGSKWGQRYIELLTRNLAYLKADALENDGPYPGDLCASKTHPGHRGLKDSQWKQWKAMVSFYQDCRAKGIYINAPDWYFLSGSNKNGMGYKEVNWSLPRERQIIIARQNIYDGTWNKTPSMGWMFTPLTVYHPVGDYQQSTLEPLETHLDFYEWHLVQNFGSGVQSCYRGPRLFDTDKTKDVVKKWVEFFKQYRDILESDIIHLRRPDGRHIDGILHVNPHLKLKGLAIFYNPLNEIVNENFTLPLYYTGLKEIARLSQENRNITKFQLKRDYTIELLLKMKPHSWTWFIIE